MTQLSISSLSKAYGAFKVFDGLDLEAKSGEIVVVFGGSGTGKTILLRLIAGVEEPTSGLISINGQDVTDVAPEHRHVGMAFQNFALFPHMSAADNIATPLLVGWLRTEPWPPFYESMTLMFQREVAERIVAAPGQRRRSLRC